MYEMIDLDHGDFYVDCPVKMGIMTEGNDAWLIDSGLDADAGRRVLKIIAERGWTLKAVLNTHAHADHIGGNAFIKKRTGCAIYAPGVEASVAAYTFLEPAMLFGGCPPQALRTKFLMAPPEPADDIANAPLPPGVEVYPLPGHSPAQIAIKSQSGAWFIGDAVVSENTIIKYGVTYLYDIAAHLGSLNALKTLSGRVFVPSHAEVTTDIAPLTDINIAAVNRTVEMIKSILITPATCDHIIQSIFDAHGLTLDVTQYALIGATVRSYLAYLLDRGEIALSFDDNLARFVGVTP